MKTFKILLLVGLVFLAGVVAGVVGTRIAIRHWVRSAIQRPQMVQTLIERRLNRQLRLDANQQAQVHQILTGARGQLRELRQEYRPQVVLIVSNADVEISALLTPAQQRRFEKMKLENRAFLQPAEPGQ
ncbi:MAG TPA: periplasmic heavy metal sensor [Verrucomicrobiae bacterium]|nr:periplasmic heavy metal sensor [Verrucomicrobiae bacterium]